MSQHCYSWPGNQQWMGPASLPSWSLKGRRSWQARGRARIAARTYCDDLEAELRGFEDGQVEAAEAYGNYGGKISYFMRRHGVGIILGAVAAVLIAKRL